VLKRCKIAEVTNNFWFSLF